ncbi:PadR family transcriptional regulator [Falsibacillus pallidus]|uniref:PadR family transcriptional regulator n=1 Tax=Falsibacillus pallidus TaxID=493781 RepID=UPI003D958516
MEERLRKLKKAMQRTVYDDLTFTEEHKKKIRNQIRMQKPEASEEEIRLSIFQLLVQKRTGFELSRLIRARGIGNFEENEGFLYMSLHQFEQKNYLNTTWEEPDIKYYQLNHKGMKVLKALEKKSEGRARILKEMVER